jgi:hypothetical protein
MKTSELTGAALDWMVCVCEGESPSRYTRYSSDWAQGGPIIEKAGIEWQWLPRGNQYGARKPSLGGMNRTFCMDGPTILVAAMRCYVASRLGDEVEVPDELLINTPNEAGV